MKKNKSFSCVFAKLCESTDMTNNEVTKLINHTTSALLKSGVLSREEFNKRVEGKTSRQVVSEIIKINNALNKENALKGRHIVDEMQSIDKAVSVFFTNYFYAEMVIAK